MSLILGLFTFILVVISIFMVLIILAQRAKNDGGVGAALGGGATEAAFGAESGNILSRATTYSAVAFFVIAFGLYLGHIHVHRNAIQDGAGALPSSPELIAAPSSGDDAAGDSAGVLDMPSITFPVPSGAESDAGAAAETASEARGAAVEATAEETATP